VFFRFQMNADKTKNNKASKRENNFPLVRINEGEKWYEHEYNEKLDAKIKQDPAKLAEAETMATKLLERDCERAEILRKQKGQSDAGWISKVIKSGTQADKISAVQLMSQMEPVHSLSHVNSLIELLKKHRTREGIPILSALKDIFVDELLPENRKLVSFKLRPIKNLEKLSSGNIQTVEKRLILWKFEDDLKKCYDQFVQILEAIASSQIETVAIHACRIISELLTKKPEQESVLLGSLANKLGHPNKVVASSVSDFLYNVCNEHPAMRFTVVSEVERVTFRKNIPLKAQMYAAHFMSRIVFSEGDSEIAVKLLQIYFTLFKLLIKAELDNHRIVAIIMIGANRALPYAKDKVDQLMPEIDSLYKIVHVEKFSIALAALKVLFQMQSLSKSFSDRFYCTFYRRLLTVHSSTHDTEFFHLLERVILSDESNERVKAFLKRMLQLALCNPPAFATAALLLYFKVSQQKQGIIKLAKNATDALLANTIGKGMESDDEEEHYVDVDVAPKVEKKPVIQKIIYVKGKAVTKLTDPKEKKLEVKPEVNGIHGQKGWIHRKDR
jgi:ribosome biogenesis protein MAK21